MGRDKHWQATMWLDGKPMTVYGPTLKGLRSAAQNAVLQAQDTVKRLENMRSRPSAPYVRVVYLWMEAGLPVSPEVRQEFYEFGQNPPDPRNEPGWHALIKVHNQFEPASNARKYMGDADAAAPDFSSFIVPEKGPEYVDEFAGMGELPKHRIQTLKQVVGEEVANKFIEQGWYILSIEPRGKVEMEGDEVIGATPAFTLGHPEPNAI